MHGGDTLHVAIGEYRHHAFMRELPDGFERAGVESALKRIFEQKLRKQQDLRIAHLFQSQALQRTQIVDVPERAA